MATIHDKSSFIPGGDSVQPSQRNTFLGVAEGEHPQKSKHANKASRVRGQATTAKKRTGVGSIGKQKGSAPGKGSMKKITPS
jgi:hypothetical protein